jgi:peptide/nickel transport system permease protein
VIVLLGKRLAWCAALVLFVVTIAFVILHLTPGDPARALVGPHATEETLAHARALHGLDRSLPAQYVRYLGNVLTGELGISYRNHRPVIEVLREHLWPTFQLILAAVFLQLLLGIPLGALAARYRRRWPDRLISAGSLVALAAPPFVVGTVLLYVAGFRLGWLPINGYGEGFFDRLAHLVLPTFTIVLGGLASTVQLLRTELIDALAEDYSRTARAKGVGERGVVWRHALRPSLSPVMASTSIDLGWLITGAVVAESIFGWPGLGREALLAVLDLDIPLVLGLVIVTSVTVALSTLLFDLLTLAIDPRTRGAD